MDTLLSEEKEKAAAKEASASEELSEGVAKLNVREAPERREEPRRFNTEKYSPRVFVCKITVMFLNLL